MFDTPDDFLPERRASNTIYLSIYEGKLCQRRATEQPGFVEYKSISQKTKGKVSWIREFDHLNGFITGFERREKETLDGSKYVVVQVAFNSGKGHTAILEVPVRSEFIARFAKCVENMDLSKPLYVRAFLEPRSQQTCVMFKQENANVAQKYTKDHQNGLPEWKKDPITGDYDTRDYWAFLFDIIARVAIPQIERNKKIFESIALDDIAEQMAEASVEAPPKSPDDDIPF